MKKILSVITLLCMIVNIYTVGSYAAIYSAGENIAPQSKVTASTAGGDAGSNAASVIDGMTQNTSGIYKWFVLNGCNGTWLEFDFPQNVTLCGAKVYSGSPVLMEGAKYDILEDFRIDGYVNGEWQPLAEISGNSARETKITFDRPVESGKYRLISTTDARFRITEVELYEGVKSDSYYESGNMIEIAGAKGEFYAKALRMLTNIGLYEYNADFFAYDPCSKGEFIKSVLRLMNVENAEHMSEGSVYSDIAWGDEYAYLRAAETAGIIGIDGKKEFNPEAELNEEEAAQILVCMLGYGARAEALGGYPSGYVKTAADLKLFKNTQRRKDKLIQKGNAVVLLYNAANTDVYEQTSFGKFGKFEKTGTALEVYHNIYREEGVVTKTEITGIDGNPCGRGKVAVNDTEYRVGDTNAGIYLGYFIKAYVREDSDTDTIVYFEVSDSNTVYTVMGEDVARDSTLTKIRYYNDKNVIRSINVSNKAYYLRNGTCDEITPAVLAPGYGKLIIIDNDNDGRADVVFIHEWIHMVVSDVIDGVIYDKLGDEIIDTQKTDALIIYRNGVECSLDSVSENDVLTVEKSPDGRIIRIMASGNFVTGTITGIDTNKDMIAYIDGEPYIVDKDNRDSIHMNLRARFLLDTDGRIVMLVDKKEARICYGILLNTAIDEMTDTLRLRILNENGNIEWYDTKDKLYINGYKIYSTDVIYSSYIHYGDNKNIVQLVRYRIDPESRITALYTAAETAPADEPKLISNADEQSLVRYKNINNCLWYDGMLIENNRGRCVIQGDETVTFKVPEGKQRFFQEDCTAEKGKIKYDRNNWNGAVEVYNLDKEYCAGAILFREKAESYPININSTAAVVCKVKTALLEDESVGKIWSVYENGELKEYELSSDCSINSGYNTFLSDFGSDYKNTDLSTIAAGDVVQLFAQDNKIKTVRILAKMSDMKDSNKSSFIQLAGGDNAEYIPRLETLCGRVSLRTDKNMYINVDGQDHPYYIGSASVYEYSADSGRVEKSAVREIVSAQNNGSGDFVFVRADAKKIQTVIIIRG